MNLHAKIALVLVLLGAAAVAAYKFVWPRIEERRQVAQSDARHTRGKLVIGVDNWVGYFPLCSSEMQRRVRADGYLLQCDDDQADLPARLNRLRSGEIQFAVATVDAYLKNGGAAGFPGTVVAVIDESKGGDAIVAWQDKLASLDALKRPVPPPIAFTPNSPSEHLLRVAAAHFDVPALKQPGAWRVETQGSSQALQHLLSRKTDAAVLWEPDVSRALATPGVIKLLSTGDADKLIVDVLIAGRPVLQQDEVVQMLLKHYFDTLNHYRDRPDQLERDVAAATKLPSASVRAMLAGVQWIGLNDNHDHWLGARAQGLVDVIGSSLRILQEARAISGNPLPNEDPYRIVNSQFAAALHAQSGSAANGANLSLPVVFQPLDEAGWSRMREVGTLKPFQVGFRSGTAELGVEGREALDQVMDVLRHYPSFRLKVAGHTGTNGDADQNRQLSAERADAVVRYLNVTHAIDLNRMRVLGHGGERPLPRSAGESDRAYQYRLPRVEVTLLKDGP
jgi:outer membrane protein OmpA-like peptidoglycan-associated protein